MADVEWRVMCRVVLIALLGLAVVPVAEAAQPTPAGNWRRLPAAPAAAAIPYERVGVWTGKQLLVFGRGLTTGGRRNVAFAYTPASGRWRTLSPPAGPNGSSELEGATAAVWTGRAMLVWGPRSALSYDPATDRWRSLPPAPLALLADAPSGFAVWTGTELITWGGGCCGDASNHGAAYDPATGRWRKLAAAPIAGQQRPIGAWTGDRLVILPGRSPNGKKTSGAAYDPAADSWKPIAPPPQERLGARAVWDGRELLVVGGSGPPDPKTGARRPEAIPFAYDPAADRWRTLAAMDGGRYGRLGAAVVWSGHRLLVWGGETQAQGRYTLAPHGLAYDPATNRWSTLPGAPLLGRLDPLAVWTGTRLLVWGGDPLRDAVPVSDDWWPLLDGAAFATPARAPTRSRCSTDPRTAARYIVPPPPFVARVVSVTRRPLPTGAQKRLYLVVFDVVKGNAVLPAGHRYSQYAYVARKDTGAPWCFVGGGSGP